MFDRPTVEQWLHETGVEILQLGDKDEAGDGFAWVIAFKGGPFTTVVACREVDWTQLQFQVTIAVSDEHRTVLRRISDDARDRFMFDLRIALLQQQVMYELVKSEDGELQTMVFSLTAYEDTLGKSGFLRRNHRLQNVALLAIQMVQKLARFEEW